MNIQEWKATETDDKYDGPRTRDLGRQAVLGVEELHYPSSNEILIRDEGVGNEILIRDEGVESFRLGPNSGGTDYLRVEDCPVLVVLEIDQSDADDPTKFERGLRTIQWLRLASLPALKSARICSGIRSLKLRNLPVLEELDLSGCTQLAFLSIDSAPLLRKIDIMGCIKLSEVSNLDDAQQVALDIKNQIAKNQASSRLDGSIYQNMTITDIEIALQKLKSEAEAANDDYPLDFYLLAPLESCYTGGTGERYSYALFEDSYGEHTPEDCLTHLQERLDIALEDSRDDPAI